MRNYVASVLRQSLPDNEELLRDIVSQTMKNSSGSFLWVKLALKALEENWHTQEDIRVVLTEFPSGMIPMYNRMVSKIESQMSRSRNMARRILTWATCSWRPLRLEELQTALEPEFRNFINLEDTVTQICGHFININTLSDSRRQISLIHKTARDFLSKGDITTGGSPFINLQDGHHHLALVCLRYLSSDHWRRHFNTIHVATRLSVLTGKASNRLLLAEEGYPLRGYAACYWSYHVSKAPVDSPELLQTLRSFLSKHLLSWQCNVSTCNIKPPVMASPQFPPVRACIFDMDGLLINTEDIYKQCADNVLRRHGRPPLPWSIKSQLMGVPGSSNGDVFHNWAQLPISRAQFAQEQEAEQERLFPSCEPLPGAVTLLKNLTGRNVKMGDSSSYNTKSCPLVEVALASSSGSRNYARKIARPDTKAFLDLIPFSRRVLADDPRMAGTRGKPAPDIFLIALEGINASLPEGVLKILPRECLVFEDSVPGVEAARRAGMRVVWVPHPDLKEHFVGRERDVLAGRTQLVPIGEQLGELDDGWGEEIRSLEDFVYERYGISLPDSETES